MSKYDFYRISDIKSFDDNMKGLRGIVASETQKTIKKYFVTGYPLVSIFLLMVLALVMTTSLMLAIKLLSANVLSFEIFRIIWVSLLVWLCVLFYFVPVLKILKTKKEVRKEGAELIARFTPPHKAYKHTEQFVLRSL